MVIRFLFYKTYKGWTQDVDFKKTILMVVSLTNQKYYYMETKDTYPG